MLTDLKYALDLTGELPENRKSQTIVVGEGGKRVFASKLGPFYTDNIRLASKMNPTVPLERDKDYEVLYFYSKLSKKAKGKEIGAFIYFKDTVEDGEVEFIANHVGGPFVNQYELLIRVVEDLQLDSREVEFSRIEGFPGVLEAPSHLQDIGDVFGFEYIGSMLAELTSIVSKGSTSQATAILEQIRLIEESLELQLEEHKQARGNVHGATAQQLSTYDSTQLDQFFNELRKSISDIAELNVKHAEALLEIDSRLDSISALFQQHINVLSGIRSDMSLYDEQLLELNENISNLTLEFTKFKSQLSIVQNSLEQNWKDHDNLQRGIDDNALEINNQRLVLNNHEIRIKDIEERMVGLDGEFNDFVDQTNVRLEGLDYRVTQLEINGGDSTPGVVKQYDFGIDLAAKETYKPGTFALTNDNLATFGLDSIKGIVFNVTRAGTRYYSHGPEGSRMYFDLIEITYGGSGDVGYFQNIKVRAGHEAAASGAYFDYGHASVFPLQLKFNNTGMKRDNPIGVVTTVSISKVRMYGKRPMPLKYNLNLPTSADVKNNDPSVSLAVSVANASRYEWYRDNSVVANSNSKIHKVSSLGTPGTVINYKVKAFNDDGDFLFSQTCAITSHTAAPSGKHEYNGGATIVFAEKAAPGTYTGSQVDSVIESWFVKGLTKVGVGTFSYSDSGGEAIFRVTEVVYDSAGNFVRSTVVPTLDSIHNWSLGSAVYYAYSSLYNTLTPRTASFLPSSTTSHNTITFYVKSVPDTEYTYQDISGMNIDVELAGFYYTIDGREFNTVNKMADNWYKAHVVKGLVNNSTFSGGASYDPATSIISGTNNDKFELQLLIKTLTTNVPELGEVHTRLYIDDIRIVPTSGQTRYSLVQSTANNDYRNDRATLYGLQTRNYHQLTARPPVNNDIIVNSQNVTGAKTVTGTSQTYTINTRCAIEYTLKWYENNVLKRTDNITSGFASNRATTYTASNLALGKTDVKVVMSAGVNVETLAGSVTRVNAATIVTDPGNTTVKAGTTKNITAVINSSENVIARWSIKAQGALDYTIRHTQEYAGQTANRTITYAFNESVNSIYAARLELLEKGTNRVIDFDDFTVTNYKEETVGGTVSYYGIKEVSSTLAQAEFNYTPSITVKMTPVASNILNVDGKEVKSGESFSFVKGQTYRIGVDFFADGNTHTVWWRLEPRTFNDTSTYKVLGTISATKDVQSQTYGNSYRIRIDDSTIKEDSDYIYTEAYWHLSGTGSTYTPTDVWTSYRLSDHTDPGNTFEVDSGTVAGANKVKVPADGKRYYLQCTMTYKDPNGNSHNHYLEEYVQHIATVPKISVSSAKVIAKAGGGYYHEVIISSSVFQANVNYVLTTNNNYRVIENVEWVVPGQRIRLLAESPDSTFTGVVDAASATGTFKITHIKPA